MPAGKTRVCASCGGGYSCPYSTSTDLQQCPELRLSWLCIGSFEQVPISQRITFLFKSDLFTLLALMLDASFVRVVRRPWTKAPVPSTAERKMKKSEVIQAWSR